MRLANAEAEVELLAAIATESSTSPAEALRLVESHRLAAGDFSDSACADAFRAIAVLLARGATADLISVEATLGPSEAVRRAGGRQWLCRVLLSPTANVATVAGHARIVRDLAARRSAIAALRVVAAGLLDTGKALDGTLTEGASAWATITARREGLGTSEGDMLALLDRLEEVQAGRVEPVLPTGIGALDELIGGLQPTLTVLGALPGVGKSALIATMLRNLANAGRKVGLFSLEDERSWVVRRLTAEAAAVPLFVLANKPLGRHQLDRVNDTGEQVAKTLSRVVIDDRQGLTPADVVQGARDMVLNHGCKAILLDHLGELRYPEGVRERFDLQIDEALAQLRGLAKQYGVPVLVASHVKRRDGLSIWDEPKLTDFANSSSIERKARVALALSRVKGGGLRVSVLKQTNGKSGVAIELEMNEPAGTVLNGRAAVTAGYDEDERRMLSGREAAANDF